MPAGRSGGISSPLADCEDPAACLAPALFGLVCFAVYVAAAVPTLYWLDSSELAAATWTLGISHPPGHPVASLWGRFFTLLPLGSIGFRVAVSQAAAGALAVAALFTIARAVARSVGGSSGVALWLAGAAAGIYAFTWSHAIQSVRPEVYALHAALLLGAATLSLVGDAKQTLSPFGFAALLIGLALANHHVLAVVGALPIVALALGRRLSPRSIVLLLCFGLLGLGTYLYLPLRAARAPLVDWGTPTRLGSFLWVVSARIFARAVHRGSAAPVPFEAMVELGLPVVLSALLGLYLLLRRAATRRIGLFLLGEILCYGAAAGLISFDPTNPDSHGYLACGLAFTAAAAVAPWAVGASLLARRAPRTALLACASLALVAISLQLHRRWERFSLRNAYGAERVVDFMLDEVAPRGVLHTRYFQTLFALWYARSVEGVRPDIDLVHERFYSYRPVWYVPRLTAPLEGRPAYEEYDLHAPGPDPRRLAPAGLLYRPGPPEDFRAQDEAWERLLRRIDADGDDPETRKFLIWTFYLAAELRCRQGSTRAAMRMAARVRSLNRGFDTPELAALRDHCSSFP